jgi:predicted Zn-dependent protease
MGPTQQPAIASTYTIGVMKTPIEGKLATDFSEAVDRAAEQLHQILSEELSVEVKVFEFIGPHLVPSAATYSPFDFLRLGLAEKLERQIPFLLVVSEAALSATTVSYALAFPSQIMNIGILSTNRLSPEFWGEQASPERTSRRLAGLMLHTVGHLLNLEHHDDAQNAMYDFAAVEDLEHMHKITAEQREHIRRTLPLESRDAIEDGSRLGFILRQIVGDWPAIVRAVIQANPFRLLRQLPTMLTAAFSVIIVLFFTAEIWDVASTVELGQLIIFSGISLVAATAVLYRAFAFATVLTRRKRIAESIVVTTAATVLSLIATMALLYILFLIVSYLGTIIIFPRRLMTTWPTVDPATRVIDHIKLSMFLAAVGLLAGSLGGRADSQQLVRYVLFLDEET